MANGPLAVALTMESVDAGLKGGLQSGLRFESMAFGLSAAPKIGAKVPAPSWRNENRCSRAHE